ncbi:uncharacterized protein P884DRAFT_61707 [Thermothelomyces heterothallicus CBS 202.75]|uniref:uncharacterized protein n=1 Tax=Thermothelomyces heterothallicus CBS 202.75 TaxID=1149848 RepID=UPI00374406CF
MHATRLSHSSENDDRCWWIMQTLAANRDGMRTGSRCEGDAGRKNRSPWILCLSQGPSQRTIPPPRFKAPLPRHPNLVARPRSSARSRQCRSTFWVCCSCCVA